MYLRSDEAGCYHNSSLLAALRDVGSRQGIDVVRYDFSEPQHGKDVCDRILCPMKAAVKRYCNEGHDILMAQDMQTALKERPVRGTTAGVFCMNISLKLKKTPNFSALYNFEFTPGGLRMWKAFKIGAGKLIAWNDITFCPKDATCLSGEKPFFAISAREMDKTTKHCERIDDISGTFECPHPQCSKEFLSRAELETHLSVTANHSPVKMVQRSVYDHLRIDWVQRFQSISLDCKRKSRLQKEVQIETTTVVNSLQMKPNSLHKS